MRIRQHRWFPHMMDAFTRKPIHKELLSSVREIPIPRLKGRELNINSYYSPPLTSSCIRQINSTCLCPSFTRCPRSILVSSACCAAFVARRKLSSSTERLTSLLSWLVTRYCENKACYPKRKKKRKVEFGRELPTGSNLQDRHFYRSMKGFRETEKKHKVYLFLLTAKYADQVCVVDTIWSVQPQAWSK